MINPGKEEDEFKDNKENPDKVRPSTTKYSTSIGETGTSTNLLKTLDSEYTGTMARENQLKYSNS